MADQSDAIHLARSEVNERNYPLTRQLLAVNPIDLELTGEPKIARVVEESGTGGFHVYLPVKGEPYLFLVHVRPDRNGRLAVDGMQIVARIRVRLVIRSDDFTSEKIRELVGIEPTSSHVRGDLVSPRTTLRCRHHSWFFEPQEGVAADLHEKTQVVLGVVDPVASRIAALQPRCSVTLSVVYDGWGGNPQFGGLHLSAEETRRIAALGAAIDVELYAWGPEMPQ